MNPIMAGFAIVNLILAAVNASFGNSRGVVAHAGGAIFLAVVGVVAHYHDNNKS